MMSRSPTAGHSALYPGVVVHRRRGEIDHDMHARVVMALFDLDELSVLDERVRGFGVDRVAPVAFRASDHGHGDGSSLRTWLHEVTTAAGVDDVSGRARVLCMPRVLGHAFDPISVWFCHDRAGDLSAVVHEVRNTFGQRHAYVVPQPLFGQAPTRDGGHDREPPTVLRHHADKVFHVSPFFDVDGDYDFTLTVPGDRATIGITHHAGDGHTLTASFTGSRRPFTTRALWQSMVRHPALTHRVTAGIRIDAAKLWRKGASYRRVPEQGRAITVATPIFTPSPSVATATDSKSVVGPVTASDTGTDPMSSCPHEVSP